MPASYLTNCCGPHNWHSNDLCIKEQSLQQWHNPELSKVLQQL